MQSCWEAFYTYKFEVKHLGSIEKLKKVFPALQQEVQKSLHENHLLQ